MTPFILKFLFLWGVTGSVVGIFVSFLMALLGTRFYDLKGSAFFCMLFITGPFWWVVFLMLILLEFCFKIGKRFR